MHPSLCQFLIKREWKPPWTICSEEIHGSQSRPALAYLFPDSLTLLPPYLLRVSRTMCLDLDDGARCFCHSLRGDRQTFLVAFAGHQESVFFVGLKDEVSGGRDHPLDGGQFFRHEIGHFLEVCSFHKNQ
jgi:hypothetical protein